MSKTCRLVALLLMISSCSVIRMRGVDPDWDGKREPACSESYLPVLIDGITATSIAGAVARDAQEWSPLLSKDQMVLAGIVSLLYVGSAAIGSSRYKECRRVRADWIARQAVEDSSPQTGPPAPAPRAPGTSSSAAPAPAAPPASTAAAMEPP